MPGVDILASAMTGANATFLADLYARWVQSPDSVDPSFQELFAALNDDARAVLGDAAVIARLRGLGLEAGASTPEQLGVRFKSEIARWAKVIKAAGIKAGE